MATNKSKVRVFFIKLLKILLTPIARCRKWIRKGNTRQITISFCAAIICVGVVAYFCRLSIKHKTNEPIEQSWYVEGTPMIHVPLDEVYKDLMTKEHKDYVLDDEQEEPEGFINTPGCTIPIAMVDYKNITKRTKGKTQECGNRAIFLRKHDYDKVIAQIKTRKLRKFAKNNTSIQCCYKFLVSTLEKHERNKLILSDCIDFEDGSIITLQSDFINVICTEYDDNKIAQVIYEDTYAFTKKIDLPKIKTKTCKVKYNVLILGMDSMSVPRFMKTMPRTLAYFKDNSWLAFTGYHKIADNSLPNLMAALTGRNMSSIIPECFGAMDDCNDLLIWKAFKDAGYATAYGEENLKIANTFIKGYAFHNEPTDHYLKPFFENFHKNKSSICTGKVSSVKQLLDYAVDFANTYKKESFFGFFWLNSFSYDVHSRPEDADKMVENFMNQLAYTGVMANTFIMFLSDHGLRFGSLRLRPESYYDDRLPMNFMWVPLLFKGKQPYEVRAIALNQRRLVTPYDMYSTLLDIKKISLCSNTSVPVPEGCRKCQSLFQIISNNRTCQDANIHDNWCSCHKLFPLPKQDPIGMNSVNAVVAYIRSMAMSIETKHNFSCALPSLQTVHRIHFYRHEDKISTFYVVAITLAPGNGTYEATVLRKDGYQVVGPISFISYYNGLGHCAFNRRDRLFCVCEKRNRPMSIF